jgi:ankyrin repeat protein
MGTPVKRRGRPPGSRNKNTLAKEAATGPATSVKPVTTPAAGDRAVVAQKRKRDEYECDVVTFLRRGGISILEALAVKLPDVFAAEILPKLDVNDTLRLAQVNKAYNDTVWSVEGVRSMEAKIKAHMVNIGKNWIVEPLFWAAEHGNVPAVRVLLESGMDVNKVMTDDKRTALHVAAFNGHAALVKALIEAGADVNKPASPPASNASGKRIGVLRNVTPVYIAAIQGHTHVVMELIKAGADVNQATSDGYTPLYIAACNGHDGIVALLIQAGADVRKANKNGYTPMKIATDYKREKVVTLLKFYERV